MSESHHLEPPRWALELVDPAGAGWQERPGGGLLLRSLRGDEFTLVSVRAPDVRSRGESEFRRATTQAYESLHAELDEHEAGEAVRFWNMIPGILEPLGMAAHRYMTFNAGRHDAYLSRYGTEEELIQRAATATGVGHQGSDLVLHGLAARQTGRPIENPRQIPARQYSSRYGPLPPCFARATRVERPRPWLLVGGTASVVGEDSLHGSIEDQLAETARNLRALLAAASAERAIPRSVRAYYVRSEDEARLQNAVPALVGAADEIEYVHAELCRPDLLVEIEAVYQYPPARETAAA